MIFTPEQVERLPGSLVRLRNGEEVVCPPHEPRYSTPRYASFGYPDDESVFASLSRTDRKSEEDIIAVLTWSDQPNPAQPEPWDGVVRAGVDYELQDGKRWHCYEPDDGTHAHGHHGRALCNGAWWAYSPSDPFIKRPWPPAPTQAEVDQMRRAAGLYIQPAN